MMVIGTTVKHLGHAEIEEATRPFSIHRVELRQAVVYITTPIAPSDVEWYGKGSVRGTKYRTQPMGVGTSVRGAGFEAYDS